MATPQSNSSAARYFIAPCYHLSLFGAGLFGGSAQFAVVVFLSPVTTGLQGPVVVTGLAGGAAVGCAGLAMTVGAGADCALVPFSIPRAIQ